MLMRFLYKQILAKKVLVKVYYRSTMYMVLESIQQDAYHIAAIGECDHLATERLCEGIVGLNLPRVHICVSDIYLHIPRHYSNMYLLHKIRISDLLFATQYKKYIEDVLFCSIHGFHHGSLRGCIFPWELTQHRHRHATNVQIQCFSLGTISLPYIFQHYTATQR